MKIATLYLFTLLFLSNFINAQETLNLIPNPSFEDINICHKYTEPCSPKAWRSTVLKNVRYLTHLENEEAFFEAAEGERCVVFGLFNEKKKEDRSFLQVPLLAQLEEGKQYTISFAFRPERVMLQSFGIYFADTLRIHDKEKELLDFQPQVTFNFDKKIVAESWQYVEAIYTATGSEKGLIIGNFNRDAETKITEIAKRKKGYYSKRIYYAFDDFKLVPLVAGEIETDLTVTRDFIYQDSFRHIDRYAIALASMLTTRDSLAFYQRSKPIATAKKPDKIVIANTEIKVNKAFIASSINFETNSDQLLKTAYPTLKVVAEFLKSNPDFKLKITGHTDNVGSPFANQKLSEDRARAVVRFLMQSGIKSQRLLALGLGETEPVTENFSDKGRSKNRRVEFIFY